LKRLQFANISEIGFNQLLAVRRRDLEPHVNLLLLNHDANELPRREADLISVRLAARDLALDVFTGFELLRRLQYLRVHKNRRQHEDNEQHAVSFNRHLITP
jgi:hypothetical protein